LTITDDVYLTENTFYTSYIFALLFFFLIFLLPLNIFIVFICFFLYSYGFTIPEEDEEEDVYTMAEIKEMTSYEYSEELQDSLDYSDNLDSYGEEDDELFIIPFYGNN